MKKSIVFCMLSMLVLLPVVLSFGCHAQPEPGSAPEQAGVIALPEPRYASDVSIEQTLLERRSVRRYAAEPLTLGDLSQLLWAAQGITSNRGFRTAPSAGALYPLELYAVIGDVEGLTPGVYSYRPDGHKLVRLIEGDIRGELAGAALGQDFVKEGALTIVFTAVYQRTMVKYGERGIRYVHIEVGHAAQNVCLQAEALGLGVCTVGAFYDGRVSELLNLPDEAEPLYLVPVGRRR